MARNGKYLFTSESVTEGHPDKIADQISDGVLDAVMADDPAGRVACETMITTGLIIVAGEITTKAVLDIQKIARGTVREIGYDRDIYGFDCNTCGVLVSLDTQSPDIAQGVDIGGAGDQGLMFGYACNETRELMPLPIQLAHALTAKLADARKNKGADWMRPDGKSQVTVEYEGNKPKRIEAVVVSTQHSAEISNKDLHAGIKELVINPTLPENLIDDKTKIYINPTGRFVTGGPQGDCGLTGRKIIVDTYGGVGSHGGGAFSGKDPSKVDRSACYMARYIAKNCVAAGIAEKMAIQLAYAIGVAEPVSVMAETFGTGVIDESRIEDVVRGHFQLTPAGIIESLQLRRPIFRKTAAYGHFGRELPEFTWEKLDKAAAIRSELGL